MNFVEIVEQEREKIMKAHHEMVSSTLGEETAQILDMAFAKGFDAAFDLMKIVSDQLRDQVAAEKQTSDKKIIL